VKLSLIELIAQQCSTHIATLRQSLHARPTDLAQIQTSWLRENRPTFTRALQRYVSACRGGKRPSVKLLQCPVTL